VAIKEHSLRRLVLNLVANARDACAATGGNCNVSLRREHSQVVLSVSDSGCGMDAITQSHLFEAFFSTKGPAGTGLGLHSVAKILETTGATVDVWSELGVGTRITVRWPLAAPCEDSIEVRVPFNYQGVTARILFAEDEESVRRVLARGLRRAGFTVIEASDGDEAARLMVSQGPFDALCTDAVMPGMHIAKVIRGFNQHFPGRPVLVISGYRIEPTEIVTGAETGILLLQKPLTQAALVAQLNASLGAAA
jgi:CheY-like chemotaxis protein